MIVQTRVLPQIGWREWVGLPLLGVDAVKAKVDTGARSSCLHAWDVEMIPGTLPQRVRFVIHPMEDDETITIVAEAPLVDEREVRSSNGEVERRPVIRTDVTVAGRQLTTELTLTRRDSMGFRMLLGRSAVRSHFVVNPDDSFMGGGSTVSPPAGRHNGSSPFLARRAEVDHREHRHPLSEPEALLDLPPEGGS